MQAIMNAAGVVLYTGDNLTLTAEGASNGEWADAGTTTSNAVLIEDVELPDDWIGGHWTYLGGVWARTAEGDAAAAAKLDAAKAERVLHVDAAADAIRTAVLGGRTTEYQEALADAQAFQAAGFAGPVPAGVQSWLDAKNAVGSDWTAQQAAEDILATGAQWKAAQQAIRAHRLLRKEQVKAAATQAQIEAAMVAWATFAADIRAQLGLPAA